MLHEKYHLYDNVFFALSAQKPSSQRKLIAQKACIRSSVPQVITGKAHLKYSKPWHLNTHNITHCEIQNKEKWGKVHRIAKKTQSRPTSFYDIIKHFTYGRHQLNKENLTNDKRM